MRRAPGSREGPRSALAAQQAVAGVDTWRLGAAAAGSRALDYLLWRLGGALPGPPPVAMDALILFRESSAGLDAGALATLEDRVARLRARPGVTAVIGRAGGPRVGTAYAGRLARRRVEAILGFLLARGVDPSRVEVALEAPDGSLRERFTDHGARETARECRIQFVDSAWALTRN